MLVRRYKTEDFDIWNHFVSESKNGTFLFHRNFMDYHKDRFEDYSLMVYEDKKLIAILPANLKDTSLHSHQGLTYGGLIITSELRTSVFFEIFKEILKTLFQLNILSLKVKSIPDFYTKQFSDELNYIAQYTQAEIYQTDISSVINLSEKFCYSKTKKNLINKANKSSLIVEESKDFKMFWNEILIPNLRKKHHTDPVHSLDEILLLKKYFPNNIRLFIVKSNSEIYSGVIIFETEQVAHTQYISAKEGADKNGAHDYLFNYLITIVFRDKKYFDFGTSNNRENGINQGLLFWKEGFGARISLQNFYNFHTENHSLIDNLL